MRDIAEARKALKHIKDKIGYDVIGSHMRDVRTGQGITQGAMAEEMGVSSNFYASLETGSNKINLIRVLQFSAITEELVGNILAGAYPGIKTHRGSNDSISKQRKDFDTLLDQCSNDNLEIMYGVCVSLFNSLR